MSKADEFKSLLPSYYYESRQMNVKCDSSGIEFDTLTQNIADVTNQCFPQTATWGISFWEEFLGLPINTAESITNRRSKVISKMSRSSPMTPSEMRRILNGFADAVDINQVQRDYYFQVILGTKTSLGDIIETVISEIEEVKPAHLAYSLAIKYITNSVITRTFNRWQSDVIPICGTLLCSETSTDEFITTIGRRYADILSATFNNYLGDTFIYTSESEFIIGDGKTYVESITSYINKMQSDEFKLSSESVYVGEVS